MLIRCLAFFFWPLCCLSFFDLRIYDYPFDFFKGFLQLWSIFLFYFSNSDSKCLQTYSNKPIYR